MRATHYTIGHVTGYKGEYKFDPETIDESVRKILYDYCSKETPL